MAVTDITLENLDAKIDALGHRLDAKVDALSADTKAGFAKTFEQTQGGFEDFRAYAEFLDERVRKDMSEGFNRIERRFDRLEERLFRDK